MVTPRHEDKGAKQQLWSQTWDSTCLEEEEEEEKFNNTSER